MFKKLLVTTALIMFILVNFMGCVSKEPMDTNKVESVNLTVSVAASMKDAAKDLKEIYRRKHPKVNIVYNFASSGTLQRQIEQGAPVDLFISASKAKMDVLAKKGLIINDSQMNLVSNEIVLITSQDNESIDGFDDLAKEEVNKISIGVPESVPAGRYAKETLSALKLWDEVQTKVVLAKDVRQVLAYVETGNVEGGLVYKTDAMISKHSKIVATAPRNSHKPIVYPMAIINGTKLYNEAKKFIDFLSANEAQKIFKKHGFITSTT
ncbi:MAG: molybdate ABC transporter substrate-binding protein [Firmicutes bacterium]|nr:molybdate ABC transporter substrate-binding protein [Bacillota bacterium]